MLETIEERKDLISDCVEISLSLFNLVLHKNVTFSRIFGRQLHRLPMRLFLFQSALFFLSVDDNFVFLEDFDKLKEVLGHVQIFVDHVVDLLFYHCVELCDVHRFLLAAEHEL